MCSVQEEGEDLLPEKRIESSISTRRCMKCDKAAVVIIRLNDAMCSECFTTYTTHKFRSAFGKSKLVRDQEEVLVAYSGGQCSSAMVHLIQGGLSKRAQKKLRFVPSLVYIDEGAVVKQTHEERNATMQKTVELMETTKLPFKIFTLEQAMRIKDQIDIESAGPEGKHLVPIYNDDEDLAELTGRLKLTESAENDFHKLLNNAKTLTAKQNIIQMLRLRLLTSVARKWNISKVFLGDCATRLSVRLLSNISQGQGAHLPYEISFADSRFNDVLLIRPMREFTAKEVSMYNNLNGVQNNFCSNLSTKAPTFSSIERLTEDFVCGLQAEYPNTVSTIFRTGEKFDSSEMVGDIQEVCCMCHCPLDTSVSSSSALYATKFSQSLCSNMAKKAGGGQISGSALVAQTEGSCASSCNADMTDPENTCCGEGDGSCHKPSQLSRSDIDANLCYGCQLITRDLGSVMDLPSHIIQDSQQKTRRKLMKNEIADFLLDA